MSESDVQARIFKVLSTTKRVRIIELLKQKPLCVNELSHELGITIAAVSQHLRILRTSGIITADRQGYFIFYHVNPNMLDKWNQITRNLLEPAE